MPGVPPAGLRLHHWARLSRESSGLLQGVSCPSALSLPRVYRLLSVPGASMCKQPWQQHLSPKYIRSEKTNHLKKHSCSQRLIVRPVLITIKVHCSLTSGGITEVTVALSLTHSWQLKYLRKTILLKWKIHSRICSDTWYMYVTPFSSFCHGSHDKNWGKMNSVYQRQHQQ